MIKNVEQYYARKEEFILKKESDQFTVDFILRKTFSLVYCHEKEACSNLRSV